MCCLAEAAATISFPVPLGPELGAGLVHAGACVSRSPRCSRGDGRDPWEARPQGAFPAGPRARPSAPLDSSRVAKASALPSLSALLSQSLGQKPGWNLEAQPSAKRRRVLRSPRRLPTAGRGGRGGQGGIFTSWVFLVMAGRGLETGSCSPSWPFPGAGLCPRPADHSLGKGVGRSWLAGPAALRRYRRKALRDCGKTGRLSLAPVRHP